MIFKRKFILENSLGKEIEFSSTSDFVLKHIDGISSNFVEISTSKGANQIGETITNMHVKSKTLTIDGVIKNNTLVNRDILLNNIFPLDNCKLKCLIGEDEYYLDVICTTTPSVQNVDYGARFQILFYATYPFWKAKGNNVTSVNGIEPKFSFPRNFSGTWKIGDIIRNEFINVVNEGNFETGMEIKIFSRGVASNFTITNVKTMRLIKLNYTMQANEIVTITTGYNNKKAVSNINGNLFRYLDLANRDFQFLQLTQGDNILKYQVDVNQNNTECTISNEIVRVGI